MNKLDKAIGGMDVIDVLNKITSKPKMNDRKAIDILNDVIRMLNKNKCYESAEKLDEVRQYLGRDL